MSQPAASPVLRRGSVSAEEWSAGVLFRLQHVVRRDIVTAAGVGSLLCLGAVLYSLQAHPGLHTPFSLILVLVAEVAGLATATVWVIWALGLAVRVDAEGIHRFNLLFPEWVRHIRWDDLGGAVPRPWFLSVRPGYPADRIALVPHRGPEQILPPLDDQRTLLELARRHIDNRPLGAKSR